MRTRPFSVREFIRNGARLRWAGKGWSGSTGRCAKYWRKQSRAAGRPYPTMWMDRAGRAGFKCSIVFTGGQERLASPAARPSGKRPWRNVERIIAGNASDDENPRAIQRDSTSVHGGIRPSAAAWLVRDPRRAPARRGLGRITAPAEILVEGEKIVSVGPPAARPAGA